MKKQFTILLILIFILGLVPLNFSTAITQNQIDAEVQIICTDGAGNWFSGSGTIIDPKGIILTNRHVIEGAYQNTCVIGFIESINQELNFGTSGNYNLAEVKYYTTTSDMDAAILYLDNSENKNYPYVNIWNSDSNNLQFGAKLETIGFPGIGGSTITYTTGDFSGFGSISNGTQNYIKTTAILEHGNSGGAAYNTSGQFIGIPTSVVVGSLNSIGYILSVNSIKSWLNGVLGTSYKETVTTQTPTPSTPTYIIQQDITPPTQKSFYIGFYAMDENDKEIYFGNRYGDNTGAVYQYSRLRFSWEANCASGSGSDTCINDEQGRVVGYYYYFGNNPNAIPKEDGKYISHSDMIQPNPDYARVKLPEIVDASSGGSNYFILQAVDDSGNISNPIINFEYVYSPDTDLDIRKMYVYDTNKNLLGRFEYPTKEKILENPGRPSVMWFEYVVEGIKTGAKNLILSPEYEYNYDGLIYYISYDGDYNFGRQNSEYRQGQTTNDKYININNINTHERVNLYLKPNKESINIFKGSNRILDIEYDNSLHSNEVKSDCGSSNCVVFYEMDLSFAKNLKGQILLQVESLGEAYYIYPDDSKKYYLGRPADAFNVMRELGLGATHQFINNYTIYPDHVLGKILIDVEQNGEAYYIYPKDKKAYYLGRPADAFRIMRELGLGITNNDLNKIPEGSL